ncbi:MAG: DUF4214 domain-containing protein, partial [Rhodobacteraceae bacterium]|nr:DUF4214 domain-containing protein [Paracoccaceae bacterium]
MLRSFDLNGRIYQTFYDGSYAGFAARDTLEPDRVIPVEVGAQLFAANRYYDLVRDIDPVPIVDAADQTLLAAGRANATGTALGFSSALISVPVNTVIGTALGQVLVPISAEAPYSGWNKDWLNSTTKSFSSDASPLKQAEIFYKIGLEWAKVVAEHGRAVAELGWIEDSIRNAGEAAFTARGLISSLERAGGEDQPISVDTVLQAYLNTSIAYGTANRAMEALRAMSFGDAGLTLDDRNGLTVAIKSLGDAFLGWIPDDVESTAKFAGKSTASVLGGALSDDLAKNSLKLVKTIISTVDTIGAVSVDVVGGQLAEDMLAFYEEGLNRLDVDLFQERLVGAVDALQPTVGFQSFADAEGNTTEDAKPLQLARQSDGSVSATVVGSLSRFDQSDTFEIDLPQGGTLRFVNTGVTTRLLDANGDRIDMTFSSGRFTSPALEAGTFFLQLQGNGRTTEVYEFEALLLQSDLLAPDDQARNAIDLGTLGAGTTQVQDDLGGPLGIDIVDHYTFTLDDPSAVTVRAVADGNQAEFSMRLAHEQLFDAYEDRALFIPSDAEPETAATTQNLSAGTYIVAVQGDGLSHDYRLEIDVTPGFAGESQSVAAGTEYFGDGDDVINQSGGFVIAGGGADTIEFYRGILDAGPQDDIITVTTYLGNGEIDGGPDFDTLRFNGARYNTSFVDADGEAIAFSGDSVSDFLAERDGAARLGHFVFVSNEGMRELQVAGIERIEVLGTAADSSLLVWTPELAFVEPGRTTKLRADWSGITQNIVVTQSSIRGVDGFAMNGAPRTLTALTGSGDDVFDRAAQYVFLDTGAGEDLVIGDGEIATGAGDDTVTGTGQIDLGDDNDFVHVTGAATVQGGDGHDVLLYDMRGAQGGYYSSSVLYTQILLENGEWVRPSGADAGEILDQIATAQDWRIAARNGSGSSADVIIEIDGIEEIHLGGGAHGGFRPSAGDVFVAFDGVASVNGYARDDYVYAEWSDATESISNEVTDDGIHVFSNGFQSNSVEYHHVRTGSGDDRLILSGSAYTGLGADSVLLNGGYAETGGGNDTVTFGRPGLYQSLSADLGDDDDLLFSEYGTSGTIDGGAGMDVAHVSGNAFYWTPDPEGPDLHVGDMESYDAIRAHYDAGGTVVLQSGSGRIFGSGSRDTDLLHLTGFETVHQVGRTDNQVFVELGQGSFFDGGEGNQDRLYADWSAFDTPVAIDFTVDDKVFDTPGGGRVSNINEAFIRTGDGDDRLWLDARANNIETNGGDDQIVLRNGSYGDKTISTGAGEDFVRLNSSRNATAIVDLGINDDTIHISNARANVDGGDGVDTLVVTAGVYTMRTQNDAGDWTSLNAEIYAEYQAGNRAVAIYSDAGLIQIEGIERMAVSSRGGSHLWDVAETSFLRTDPDRSTIDYFHLGSGNDLAQGMGRADYYYFYGDFGSDRIEDTSSGDRLIFESATLDQVTLTRVGLDLVAATAQGGEVTVADYFAGQPDGRNWRVFAQDGEMTVDWAALGLSDPSDTEPAAFAETAWQETTVRADTVTGTESADYLAGSAVGDVIAGLGGNDLIDGNGGADTVNAGAGNDLIYAGETAMTVDGGIGQDVLDYRYVRSGSLVVDLADGSSNRRDVLSGIEDIAGLETGNNRLTGDAADNRLVTFSGNDAVFGAAGNDTLITGDGDDTLDGGAGADILVAGNGDDLLGGSGGPDTIEGGAGIDTLSFAEFSAGHGVVIDVAGGNVSARSGGAPSLASFSEIEAFAGTAAHDDILIGGDAPDDLSGLDGDDFLYGDGIKVALVADVPGQVYRLYQATLGRAPDSAGHQGWSRQLFEGETPPVAVAAGFVGSTEFQNVYSGLDDAGFVGLLYQNVLGRAAQAAEITAWTDLMAAGRSRPEVVLGFSDSSEFQNATRDEAARFALSNTDSVWSGDIFRLYQATLDRAPDRAGFAGWADALGTGTPFDTAVTGFVASPEFQNTYGAVDDSGFVNLLYNNVLGRDGDSDGLRGWLAVLADGGTRAEVVRGFSQSAEFTAATAAPLAAWMRAQGVDDVLDGGAGANVLTGGLMGD